MFRVFTFCKDLNLSMEIFSNTSRCSVYDLQQSGTPLRLKSLEMMHFVLGKVRKARRLQFYLMSEFTFVVSAVRLQLLFLFCFQ